MQRYKTKSIRCAFSLGFLPLFLLYVGVSVALAMGKMPMKKVAESEATAAVIPLEAARALLENEAFPSTKEIVYVSREDILRLALMRNLDILIARVDAEIESLELQKSKAVFDTLLTIDADYELDELGRTSTISGTRETTTNVSAGLDKTFPSGTTLEFDIETERSSTDSTFATINPSYDTRAKVTLTQPLLKNRLGLLDRGEIQKVTFEISQMDEEVARRVLKAVAQVEKDYWALVLAQEEESIKKEALEKAEALLAVNLDKFDRGLVEEADLYASQANVAQRQSDLVMAENKTRSMIKTLKLGLNDFSGTILLPLDRFQVGAFRADLEESLIRAFESRNDYRKMRLELEKNDLEIHLDENRRWPKLDIEASLTANGLESDLSESFEELSRGNQRDYFVGVSLELPIENREANANSKQSRLRKLQSLLSLQKMEREIFHEIEERVRAVNALLEKVRYAKEAEIHQRRKLDEKEKDFGMGRSDVNTLVDFQQDLLQAKMESVRALHEYYQAAVDLSLAEGSFLDHLLESVS